MRLLLLSLILILSTSLYAEGVEKDTASAAVVYGEQFLLDNLDSMSIDSVRKILVELEAAEEPNLELIAHLRLYCAIPSMDFNEVYGVVDSLFELEEIPFPLINQINWYVANHSALDEEMIDTSMYPAEGMYASHWNTVNPNPYNKSVLSTSDTLVELPLIGLRENDDFVLPIEGVMTSPYGWRDGRNHNGVDIDLQVWDSVYSSFPGMVRVARWYGGYGRVVVVRHFNGLETLYAHLHRLKVEPGQLVGAGDLIGLGGSSGQSTGSHLHWEVRYKGVPINPSMFIDFKEGELVNDTLVLKQTSHGFAAFPKGSTFHTVRRGDYLYKIANSYGMSVGDICRLNGIRRNQILVVGQQIRVL